MAAGSCSGIAFYAVWENGHCVAGRGCPSMHAHAYMYARTCLASLAIPLSHVSVSESKDLRKDQHFTEFPELPQGHHHRA